jgi:hypothetical protein
MEITRLTPEDCMESDYRSSVLRSRRTKEVVWKGPEELKKLYGKD